MIGRNKRGIRRASTRVRLAVAAAVLVGGGAAGVAAVAASHNTPVNAASAGYYRHSHTPLSETHAMSAAMSSVEQVAANVAQPDLADDPDAHGQHDAVAQPHDRRCSAAPWWRR